MWTNGMEYKKSERERKKRERERALDKTPRYGSNKIQQKRRVNHVEICVHSMPCRYIVFAGWRIV